MKLSSKILILVLLLILQAAGQVQGDYSLSEFTDGIANYQNITIKITDKFISVRGGCNIHTGYFNVSGQSKVAIGPFSSTKIKCPQDNDQLFIQRLITSASFILSNGFLTLQDQNNKAIAKFKRSAEEAVDINALINEIVSNASGNAGNPIQPSSPASAQGNTATNSQQQSTTTSSTGSSTSGSQSWNSNPLFSPEIMDLLNGVKKVSLSGRYKPTNINDDKDIVIVFKDGDSVSIQNGCNIHSGIYNAFENGTITIGKFFSTRRACREDFDKIYLDALTKTDNYQRESKNLVFRNGSNIVLALAWQQTQSNQVTQTPPTPNVVTPPNVVRPPTQNTVTPPTVVTPSNPTISPTTPSSPLPPNPIIQQSAQIYFSGQFTTDLLLDNDLRVKFDMENVQIVNGCNLHGAVYKAYENGTISIGPFRSTRRACLFDEDNAYLTALISSVFYNRQNGQIQLRNSSGQKTLTLTPPPVAKPIFFEGNYSTSIQSNPNIIIRFSGNQVNILNGCNSYSGQYEADTNGRVEFKAMAGTLRACLIDFDSEYIRALSNSVSFTNDGTIIIFRDTNKVETITLTQLKADFVQLSGRYSTNLPNDPNILIEFSENRVSLVNGCNSQGASYKAFSNGTFTVDLFISTLIFCENDNDGVYTKALSQSVSFTKNPNNSLTFRDSKGSVVLMLTPFVNKPKQVVFNNTYKPNLNDDEDLLIRLDLSGRVSIVNGCNLQSGSYKASDDGSITFSQFISTRMFCQNDKDSVYTNALSNSVSFKQQGNQITLFSSTGVQTLKLTQFVITPPVITPPVIKPPVITPPVIRPPVITPPVITPPVIRPPVITPPVIKPPVITPPVIRPPVITPPVITPPVITPPVVKPPSSSRRQFFPAGNYKPNMKQNQALLVAFTNDGKVSILNGCNLFSSEYFAYSNGSVEFKDFAGTFKYCRNDNDYLYLNALVDAFTYAQNGNQITLKDDKGKTTIILTRQVTLPSSGSTKPNTPTATPQTKTEHQTGSTGNGQIQVVQSTTGDLSSKEGVKVYYSLTPSLKIFDGHLILNENDEYLYEIMTFLERDYQFFVRGNTILGGFKRFRTESIDYQIVFKSAFGTFNAIAEYRPQNSRKILLKSLAIIDFWSLETSYAGCETRDTTNRNCRTCATGFRNFRGRCFAVDNNCATYLADQCIKCNKGKVMQGTCQL